MQASLAGIIAFAVYVRTLAPTVMWYDMGEFAMAAYVLGIAHNTGYPLYILLGKLFTFLPVGDIAFRVNLMSAFFAALTVLVMYLIVYQLTQRRTAAWVAALTIAFSSTLWANATWAVSYDLNAFLTVLILFLLLRWMDTGRRNFLYIAALTFGLSLGNHRLILVVALPAIYLIWHVHRTRTDRLRWQGIVALAVLFLVGFSVNLYLPIRAAQDPPYMWADASDLQTFLKMVFTGAANRRAFIDPFQNIASLRVWGATLTIFPIHELTVPGLILAALGGFALFRARRPFFYATFLIAILTVVMISIYGIHNIFNYFLPIYLLLSVWIGYGANYLLIWVDRQLPSSLEVRFEILTPQRRMLLVSLLMLMIPLVLLSRNFQPLDRSQHRNAKDFANYLLSSLEENTIVLADFWSWAPLKYSQLVEGKGSGVAVLSALSDPNLDQEHFLDGLLEAGAQVYVTVSTEDSPRLKIDRARLQLVAPYVIQGMTTPRQPLPEFKDLLVPNGMVYQAVSEPTDLVVDSVPNENRLEVEFEDGISLVGFDINRTVIAPGEVFRAKYYWQLVSDTDVDYWVDVLFTDEDGNVATKLGFPLWLHSHWVGGFVNPTSKWNLGAIYREVYDGLVPRDVHSGLYQIRALLYRGGVREDRVEVEGPTSLEGGVLLGYIRVEGE
jgi:hypothetical protein